VDKSREESLISVVEIVKGKRSMVRNLGGRISEISPVLRSAREVRRLRLRPEFKLRRLWTIGSSQKYPSAIGLTRSCTEFKLREWEEESSDKRRGHRNFGIREIGNHEDK
jgi:hypothetical protein